MAVQAVVTMFGKFSVVVNGLPIRIRTKPAQSLLALLCLKSGKPVERVHLAQDIWDDLDYSVSGNRLRTTLVILKQAMRPCDSIDADRTSIWIDAEACFTDHQMATALLKKVRVLQDLDEELETHHRLLDIIDQPFLSEFDEPWAVSARETWSGHRTTSLLRVSQINEELGFLTEALSAVEKVFVQDPFHAQTWMKYLRLMAKAERSNEGLAALSAAQSKMSDELGLAFEGDVLAVANQVRHGSIRPAKSILRFSSAEKTVLIAALENMATTAPDEFLGFLASKSFNENVFQRPSTAFSLMFDALNNASADVDSNLKGKLIRTATTAAFTLSYHAERENLCNILIDQFPEESDLHASGLAQLAFLKFEQRDMETATDLAKRAIEVSQKYRLGTYNRALESSLAACYWHCLKFDEAEAIYESLLRDLGAKDEYLFQYNLALMNANFAFLKSVRRDWNSCHEHCTEAWKTLTIHGFDTIGGAVAPLLGCAKVMLEIHGGPLLIIDGLKNCYRQRNTRVVEISLDYTACALVKLGSADRGLAVLDAVTVLRDARAHFGCHAKPSPQDIEIALSRQ